MAKTYYDSAFTGAQIDAAVRVANKLATVSVSGNSGKLVGINATGDPVAIDAPAEYDDTTLAGRVTALEEAIDGLLDATGVSF